MSTDKVVRELFVPDCKLCKRLVDHRRQLQKKQPDWHNAPVPSFGSLNAPLLIVGLAPGGRGANRTGRPFTGGKSGIILFKTLTKFGFVHGEYSGSAEDGISLRDCRITNAVKCALPDRLPKSEEITICAKYLGAEIKAMPKLRTILCLGMKSHKATVEALGLSPSNYQFKHGTTHELKSGVVLHDSYHCSQNNLSNRLLSQKMLDIVFERIRKQWRSYTSFHISRGRG